MVFLSWRGIFSSPFTLCGVPGFRRPGITIGTPEKYTHITSYGADIIEVGLKDAKPDTLRFFEEDLLPIPEYFYDEFGEDFINRYAWRFVPTTGPYIIKADDIRKRPALSHRPGSGTGGRTIRNSGATATIPMRGNSP